MLSNAGEPVLVRLSVPNGAAHCAVWSMALVPYSTTPPVQAKRVKNQSDPQNERDARQI